MSKATLETSSLAILISLVLLTESALFWVPGSGAAEAAALQSAELDWSSVVAVVSVGWLGEMESDAAAISWAAVEGSVVSEGCWSAVVVSVMVEDCSSLTSSLVGCARNRCLLLRI